MSCLSISYILMLENFWNKRFSKTRSMCYHILQENIYFRHKLFFASLVISLMLSPLLHTLCTLITLLNLWIRKNCLRSHSAILIVLKNNENNLSCHLEKKNSIEYIANTVSFSRGRVLHRFLGGSCFWQTYYFTYVKNKVHVIINSYDNNV